MSQSRLSTVSSMLVEQITQCTPEQRTNAVCRACSAAIERTGLADERVSNALALACEGRAGDDTLVAELSELVEHLDNEAWDLQDKVETGEVDEADYTRAFAKARAAASVAFAINQTEVAALDSLYEA